MFFLLWSCVSSVPNRWESAQTAAPCSCFTTTRGKATLADTESQVLHFLCVVPGTPPWSRHGAMCPDHLLCFTLSPGGLGWFCLVGWVFGLVLAMLHNLITDSIRMD